MDDQKRNATERMGRLFEPDEAAGEDTDEDDNEAEVVVKKRLGIHLGIH